MFTILRTFTIINYQQSQAGGGSAAGSAVKACCNGVVCFGSVDKVILSSNLPIPSTASIYL